MNQTITPHARTATESALEIMIRPQLNGLLDILDKINADADQIALGLLGSDIHGDAPTQVLENVLCQVERANDLASQAFDTLAKIKNRI